MVVFGDTAPVLAAPGHDGGMAGTEISLVVLRSTQPEATRRFYEALGLSFVDEQHGRGPVHVSATTPSGVVFELYPLANGEELETGTRGVRLGLSLDGVDAAVEAAVLAGGHVISRDDVRALLEDPDGRKVEVTSSAG